MTETEATTENKEQENVENNGDNTELEDSIIRQVEYYFSDVNLPRDKFLRAQIQLDDGWVPLEVLIKFNRLANLSTDLEVIANALNNSTSGLLEVSEDNTKVRRNPELPIPELNEERRKELSARTVYVKGFTKTSTLDEIMNFLKQFESVENVMMRRYVERLSKKRLFKGSIFATFKTKEQAEKFLNTKDLKYSEIDLIIKWQEDYIKEKQEEYALKKESKDKKERKKKDKQEEKEKEEFKLPSGTVFRFSEVDDKIKREDIRDALTAIGAEVAYIDFKVGDKEGWARLSKENTVNAIAEKMEQGKLKIGDTEVVFKVLEADEEKKYLEKTVGEMLKRRQNQKNNGKPSKGKGNRGRSFGCKKRKQGKHNDAPPAKVKVNS